jgi:hypothetical protein
MNISENRGILAFKMEMVPSFKEMGEAVTSAGAWIGKQFASLVAPVLTGASETFSKNKKVSVAVIASATVVGVAIIACRYFTPAAKPAGLLYSKAPRGRQEAASA